MEDRQTVSWMLTKNNLTHTWLINRLADRGVDVCKTNLSDILRGVRRNETSKKVIAEALAILKEYEEWQVSSNGRQSK